MAAAAFLLLTLVLPVAAASGPNRLFDPGVLPRTGTTETTIVAVVWYRSADGSEADWVRVSFDGVSHEMTPQPGGTWKDGVEFRWSGTLAVGTGAVVFLSQGRDHFSSTLAAGTVYIVAPPPPTPTPTPRVTPSPTPTPRPPTPLAATPQPDATPTAILSGPATPAGLTPAPAGGPVDPSTSDPDAGPPPDGTATYPAPPHSGDSPVTAAIGPDGGTGSDDGTGSDRGTGGTGSSGTSASPTGGPDSSGSRPGGGPTTWGPLTGALSALGISGPSFGALSMGPTLVASTGAVAMAMAFGIFGKRRRDGEPPAPDDQLAVAAAAGVGIGVVVLAPETEVDAEAMMPRWRRPSLIQARKTDPIRDATPAPRLTFDRGLVGPLDGHERRVIRYRVVRMLDAPDELRGRETGYLDRGDEVEMVEKHGAYWLVLCPDGRQGWVHNMTLGEVVGKQVQLDRPVATMPAAAETWTMGEAGDDTDVFEAYLESRRRAT